MAVPVYVCRLLVWKRIVILLEGRAGSPLRTRPLTALKKDQDGTRTRGTRGPPALSRRREGAL